MSDLPDPAIEYRLAPVFAARLVGLGLVVLAVISFVYAAAAFAWSWPADVIVVVLVVGLLAVFAGGAWLRSRAYVVRVDDEGYDVKFVRGAGVASGRWDDVVEAVTAHPRDVPCLVLKHRNGSTTSIPVEMLAVDREQFADEVRARLDRAHRR